ncbi:hypothetical protein OUZ56_033625 [Daphnia magna]|uniref:Uncharacterized protein n=1 Tax=Daphnia magna TaxID=35525 RepID=A0ABQ9ZY33_9CRUS|nr:hypothetical protein OUZ56_033625 [Daphnia magna]
MTPSGEGSERSIQECCLLGANLWTLARQAAKRLGVRIDVSGDENLRIVADDVSVCPFKEVRGLRKVARQRYTRDPNFRQRTTRGSSCHRPLPGRQVERHGSPGILTYAPLLPRLKISSHGPARHLSSSGALVVLLTGARYELPPMRKENDTGFHVLNPCEEGFQLASKRHNTIQDLLEFAGPRRGLFVETGSMENAYQRMYDKYSSYGRNLPLVVGSLHHGTPGTTKSIRFLESTEDPWVPSDSRPDWQCIQGSMDMVLTTEVVKN